MKKYSTLKGSSHYSDEFQFQCASAEHDVTYRGWHDHDFYEMGLITQGRAYHKTLSGKRRIKKGSLVFVKPRVPHGYAVDEKQKVINFIFSKQFLSGIDSFCSGSGSKEQFRFSSLFDVHSSRPLQLKPDEFILCDQIISRIRTELDKKEKYCFAMVRSLFAELCVSLMRSEQKSGSLAEQSKESESDRRIEKTIRYIEENYSEKLSLDEIAVCASYSPAYMSNFFKKQTGYALFEYINEVRIQKACDILRNTDRTVLEVAYEVGFNSISLFNRTFKKLRGTTPRDFRKQKPEGI